MQKRCSMDLYRYLQTVLKVSVPTPGSSPAGASVVEAAQALEAFRKRNKMDAKEIQQCCNRLMIRRKTAQGGSFIEFSADPSSIIIVIRATIGACSGAQKLFCGPCKAPCKCPVRRIAVR